MVSGRRKRRFGRVRRLASGRYQARYHSPDGTDRPAPYTFATVREAERWLSLIETEILKGEWTAPDAGLIPLEEYADDWIKHRPGLRPRTIDLYERLFRNHIRPRLGRRYLSEITPSRVRAWRADILVAGVPPTTAAKAYRLLRAILTTAVDDELIRRNPCRIKGGGTEVAGERPVATVEQVYRLADLVPNRFRLLILLAAFTGLRYGELAALRRRDVDLRRSTVTVRATLVELADGRLIFGRPKSEVGARIVTVPAVLAVELAAHLRAYVPADVDALIFTGAKGAGLRRSNFRRATGWPRIVAEVGLPGFHFHDLRHTGNTLAAATGASLRELMYRMGHASARAALIYQHATLQRDREIAESVQVERERDRARNGHKRPGEAAS